MTSERWLRRSTSSEKKGNLITHIPRLPTRVSHSLKSIWAKSEMGVEQAVNSALAKESVNVRAESTPTRRFSVPAAAWPNILRTNSASPSCQRKPSNEGPTVAGNTSVAQRKKDWRVGAIYPIIPGLLHFTSARTRPVTVGSNVCYFTSDFPKQYFPFCSDFGPVNLGIIVRFCELMRSKVKAAKSQGLELIFRSSEDLLIRTNSAFLVAAYLLLDEGYSPEEAIQPFQCISPYPFKPYRDATYAPADFELSILDCLRGLKKSVSLGWFNHRKFSLHDYERWDNPENGDLHQVTPKFIAFKGPVRKDQEQEPDDYAHSPVHYGAVFRDKGVTAVVRLSEHSGYDASDITCEGFRHYDLYFDDCTSPSDELVDKFLAIAEKEDGLVAVHCKAGLGRTGTVIACHIMKHYGFTAREAISWLRMARPGSVIGPQQHYLVGYEQLLSSQQPRTSSPQAIIGDVSPSKFGRKLRETISQHSDGDLDRFRLSSEVLAMQVSKGQMQRGMARKAAPSSF